MVIINKRGTGTDLFVFMIMAFLLSIMTVTMFYAVNVTDEKLKENIPLFQEAMGTGGNATEVIEGVFGNVPRAYESLKWITSALIIGMILAILISSFLINTRPVVLVAYIFIWIIAIIVAVPLANTYEQIYQNPVLASSFSGFWGQTYIMLNLHIWVMVVGALAGIVLFVNFIRRSRYGGYE